MAGATSFGVAVFDSALGFFSALGDRGRSDSKNGDSMCGGRTYVGGAVLALGEVGAALVSDEPVVFSRAGGATLGRCGVVCELERVWLLRMAASTGFEGIAPVVAGEETGFGEEFTAEFVGFVEGDAGVMFIRVEGRFGVLVACFGVVGNVVVGVSGPCVPSERGGGGGGRLAPRAPSFEGSG